MGMPWASIYRTVALKLPTLVTAERMKITEMSTRPRTDRMLFIP